ncbi:hypothetical protein ABAC460_18605 [Asticcacaulis sp. AC460]|uniref:hypothetical protein n=1 Tax=Asticcacaulis sp. AC460 TaxID=1282360 RepID=UPI0003C3B50B|nr:hypothetical protein [Asticcacaulis sp. AC460]ESQ87685.1 hypothetical protein ABAC460_18605 [Asticcacaulis sp. AC460]
MSGNDQETSRGFAAGGAPRGPARERLVLQREDAVNIVERLRETHVDVDGHAFLLQLDTMIVRMGARWAAKCDLVFDHLKTNFEKAYPEPNWCIGLNGDAWLVMLPQLSPRKGALAVSDVWRELCGFFVGDMSDVEVPIYDVLVEDVDRLSIGKIDLNTYVGPGESDAPLKARHGRFQDEASDHGPATGGMANAVPIQRPVIVAASVNYAGRTLKVASAIEPLFEMKKMVMIGHRLEAMVMENLDNALLDRKHLANLDWNLREQVDLVNIDQGLKLLRMRTPEQRKMMMVVPAAFSTFASARARQKITVEVAKAAAEMGLKVLFEVRGLDGVPPHRILEIVSMIKPFCMTAVGSVNADRKTIATLNKCGLSGVCIEYDGVKRDEAALQDHLSALAAAAKLSAGACMVQGFDNYRQMAVARLAGVTHASMKTAALMSPKGAAHLASRAAEGLRDSDVPLPSLSQGL